MMVRLVPCGLGECKQAVLDRERERQRDHHNQQEQEGREGEQ
jgi:hypothetical protein